MGDRLRTGKPPQYFAKPPRLAQPPTLRGAGNEYQPKCGDAVRLGSIKAGIWLILLVDIKRGVAGKTV